MAEPTEKRDPGVQTGEEDEKTVSPVSNSIAEASFGVNEKALLRKLDLRLLPPLTLLYLLSFLDRSNGTLLRLCLSEKITNGESIQLAMRVSKAWRRISK